MDHHMHLSCPWPAQKHPSEGTSRTRLDMGLAVGKGLPSCTSMREGFFLQYIARCGLGKVLSPLSSISSGLAAARDCLVCFRNDQSYE